MMKRWFVITLFIPKESEEGISNFLMEQGGSGIEEVDEDPQWKRLKAYFPEKGKTGKILSALRRYLKSLLDIYPEIALTRIETASIPEQDWGQNWKKFFKPVQVTSRFVVKQPWSRIRLKKNQTPITINPGMAFGTGTHATTKLSLRALEENLKKKGLSVLDLGAGSGILSIAAAHLGASDVLGLDVDEVAVKIARENLKENGVSDTVRIRKGRIGGVKGTFDVIVANIDSKSLRRMRWPLVRHLNNGGLLILSGILDQEKVEIQKRYWETGQFRWTQSAREEEWACLTLKKKHAERREHSA